MSLQDDLKEAARRTVEDFSCGHPAVAMSHEAWADLEMKIYLRLSTWCGNVDREVRNSAKVTFS